MVTVYVSSKTVSLTSNEVVKLELEQQQDGSSSNEFNPKLTVDNLLVAIKEKLSLPCPCEDYQLVCFGKKLKGDKLLSQYGIKSNVVVHLFLKSAEERAADKKMDDSDPTGTGKKAKIDPSEVHSMMIASRTALMNKVFRDMLSRLHETDFRNNLIQCTPGLKDDLFAIACLHDADALTLLIETSVIQKVWEKHPAILEAATYLATAFHEENATTSGRSAPAAMNADSSFSSGSYSLDDLSDDEMNGGVDVVPAPSNQQNMTPTTASAFAHLMQLGLLARNRGESGGNQSNQSPNASSPMSLSSNLTPQQIQQLQLAQLQQLNAQHHQQQQQQQQQSSQQAQQQQQQQQPLRQPDNAIIAFEMLRHALQLTEPSTSQQGTNSNSISSPFSGQPSGISLPLQPQTPVTPQQPSQPSQPDMSQQIAQMRELGLTDENVCLQALMATNGDVQAAVELILNDFE